ncbi:LRRC45 [Symbiodinium sp. KB8]|nr:LRRC45 [Symbiodinium sp. KB8]
MSLVARFVSGSCLPLQPRPMLSFRCCLLPNRFQMMSFLAPMFCIPSHVNCYLWFFCKVGLWSLKIPLPVCCGSRPNASIGFVVMHSRLRKLLHACTASRLLSHGLSSRTCPTCPILLRFVRTALDFTRHSPVAVIRPACFSPGIPRAILPLCVRTLLRFWHLSCPATTVWYHFLDWESCLLPPRSSWPVPPSRVEDGAGAVSTASWAVPSGPNCFAALRKSWTSRILSGDFLAKFRANIASGAKHPPISDSDLAPFLSDLRSCLGVPEAEFQQLLHVPAGQPFRLFLLKALLSVANDPDTAFIDLLVSGVPLGVDEPMPPCPSLFPAPPASEPDMDLSHCESSWGSALSDPATVDRLLQAEVSEGWIAEVPGGLPALKRQYDRSAVGKLGLVKAPDRDPRLVVDSSVSGVTAHTHLPNKSANPTITGLRRCLPCRTSLERLFALILDVSKAHRRILIRPSDRGLLCFFHRRRLYQCLTLNFGARASGYYWARVAGLLSRLLHRLLFVRHALLIYVDDLISLFSGPSAPVWASIMCVLLLLLRVPMSWHKAYLGCRPSWIGWSMDFDSMSATLEAPKLARLRDLLGLVLRSDSVPLHLLRKLTGKLLWVCSLFRPFRPSLGPLYRDQGLPPLVHVAVSPDLWSSFRSALTPDLRLQREDLDFRPYAPGQRSQAVVRISRAFADACADCRSAGIGGFVRLVSGRCVWFRHNFSASDLASLFPWFDGHSSPQKFIAAWELLGQLALVWCIALLVPAGHPPIHFVSRCDNAPSDSASWKGISTARGLCSMLRTYFAWQRHFCVSTYIDHVPGFRNKVADGLSRSASPSDLGLAASDEVVIPWDLLSCPPRPQYYPTAAWSASVFPAAGPT